MPETLGRTGWTGRRIADTGSEGIETEIEPRRPYKSVKGSRSCALEKRLFRRRWRVGVRMQMVREAGDGLSTLD